MRLWSLHPSYLDAKGLVALWREGLLARKVLEGKTKGYTNHPQLHRFKQSPNPLAAIDVYLEAVQVEAAKRNYNFDATKIRLQQKALKINVTEGQLVHELEHLKRKLETRDPKQLNLINGKEGPPKVHPLFRRVPGRVEQWEKVTDNLQHFPYDLDFTKIDFRKHPELYVVGKGEQGVLLVEPYKSEIGQHWRFKTPAIAEMSAKKIYTLFKQYKQSKDFIGMDMSRKYLQMGYTRSRRYANHPSGRKYDKAGKILPQAEDWDTSEKAQSARIFYEYYLKVREDVLYKNLKAEWSKKNKKEKPA